MIIEDCAEDEHMLLPEKSMVNVCFFDSLFVDQEIMNFLKIE